MRGKWEPIATAPKDGTAVLLFDGFGVLLGGFNAHEDFDEWWSIVSDEGEEPDANAMEDYQSYLAEEPEGWTIFDAMTGDTILASPTHWMPLPEPPAALSQALGEGK